MSRIYLTTACMTAIVLLCAIRSEADFIDTNITAGTSPCAIAVDTLTDKIYVANSVSNNVTVIDGAANTTSTVAAGAEASAIAVDQMTDKIYVANSEGNNVTVIDGATNSTTTVAAGSYPYAVAVNPVTDKIYVTNQISNNVTVIDGVTNTTTTVAAGTYPYAIAVNPVTNKIYIANQTSNNVTVIDGATNTTTTVAAGTYPYAMAVNPVTDKIYVANQNSNNVTVIDGATNSTTTLAAGTSPSAIAVDVATNKIYAANVNSANVTVIDGATLATASVACGPAPRAVAVNAATDKIYVANYSGTTVTVIDGATNATSTVADGAGAIAIAVNPVTGRIYAAIANGACVTVSDGSTIGGLTLVSPADNASNVSFNPTLQWSAATNAIAYSVQVSTNAAFSSNLINSNVSSTTFAAALNAAGAKYYWRVAGTHGGFTGTWTVDSFTTLQIGPVALNSPADNAINVALKPTLKWSAATNATGYSVQVSTNSAFGTTVVSSSVSSDTLAVALNAVTKYYWRVAGTFGSSTGSWTVDSFTTIQIGPVTLSSPADNAINVVLNPTFRWSAAMYATGYSVQVSTNSAFSPTVVSSSVSSDTLAAALNAATKYYWRVAGTFGSSIGPWTADSFTTSQIGPAALIFPADNAINVAFNPTLQWNTATSAIAYSVQVSTNSTFSTTSINSNVSSTTLTVALNAGSKYYWRAAGTNASGSSIGPWTTDSFTTAQAAPAAPVLVTPANGAANVDLSTTLGWNSSAGATAYRLQFSTASSFSACIIDTTATSTSRAINLLSITTKYYWRVNASDAYGPSPWSAVDSFTTVLAIPPPTIVNPKPNAMIGVDSVAFRWNNDGAGTTAYLMQIALDSAMTNIVFADSAISDTTITIHFSMASQTYWFRIKARNTGGWGVFSAQQRFTISGCACPIGPFPGKSKKASFGVSVNAHELRYSMPRPGSVCVKLYSITGRMVATLVKGVQGAGSHSTVLERLTAGPYIMTFDADGLALRKTIVVP